MKVLLLIPPTDLTKSYGKLKNFSNPQPAIGISYIAAVLRENKFDVCIVDAYVNQYDLDTLMSIIGERAPDVIGISVLTPTAEVVYEISRNIRLKHPNIIIVMGNVHASLFSEEILENNLADFVVHREGELTMLELVKTLQDKKSPEDVSGISLKKNGAVMHTPPRPFLQELDSLPYPAWDLLAMNRYSTDPRTEIKRGVPETQILASRGCPYPCTFCSSRTEKSLGSLYRMRNPERVVEEMANMHEVYGSQVFGFLDLIFPLLKSQAEELCNGMMNKGLHKKIKWFTECRVKPLDQETLNMMKKSGCARVCFGIESGNDGILKLLKKNFTTDDVRNAVSMARKAGLDIDGMFMIGLPEETEETIRETIDFAIELNVRYAIFNLFVPYPGCDLYDTLKAQNKIHYKSWSDFTSYPTYSGGTPVYVPDDLSHEQLMNLQKYAMNKFYFRPAFIVGELKRLKLSQIRNYYSGVKGLLSQRVGIFQPAD